MAVGGALLLLTAGCREAVPPGALVIAQHPLAPAGGGRVVLAWPPFQPAQVRVLSRDVVEAGQPVLSPDGRRVLFSGRTKAGAPRQIFEAILPDSLPQALTRLPAGAGSPAWLGNGDFVFVSPAADTPAARTNSPALYAQTGHGAPRRLTFSGTPVAEPTVLPDGRICFVGATPGPPPRTGLFVVNNDGTEIAAFALVHADLSAVRRPRAWPDGRMAFLTDKFAGTIPLARPFHPHETLLQDCSSMEWESATTRLVCRPGAGQPGQSVYRWRPAAQTQELLLEDPVWRSVVALPVAPSIRPMGRPTTVVPGRATGTLLCLASQWSSRVPTQNSPTQAVAQVRILSGESPGKVLGEVPVERDGSFLVEVPADHPLGFETVDAAGRIIDRCPPMIWVRPGENRSCLGCHEPHNRSPRNLRVLAVEHAPQKLVAGPTPKTTTPPQ
jgi:hypothetical protein